MTFRFATLAAFAVLPTAGLAQDETSPAPSGGAALMESCADHKFETVVQTTVDGKARGQKVRICGVAGQSDADWKRTLEDAIRKVEANKEMAASTREQIIAALKLEIGKIDTGIVAPVAGSGSALAGTELLELPKSATIAPLAPGRPAAAPPPLTPARPATAPPPRSLEQDYGSYAPLPAPLPPATVATTTAAVAVKPPAPRIKLVCSVPNDPRSNEDCRDINAGTILTVQADELLSPGTSLRFLRKGDERAEVKLGQMAAGQSVRFKLPKPVCVGVLKGSVEVQVLRRTSVSAAPQVVDSHGPYELRC